MIDKKIEGVLLRPHLRNLCLIEGNMNGIVLWGIIWRDVPTMIYLIFKTINPFTRIYVYNLKYEVEK